MPTGFHVCLRRQGVPATLGRVQDAMQIGWQTWIGMSLRSSAKLRFADEPALNVISR